MMVVETLVRVVDCPPGTALVIATRTVEVEGNPTPDGIIGSSTDDCARDTPSDDNEDESMLNVLVMPVLIITMLVDVKRDGNGSTGCPTGLPEFDRAGVVFPGCRSVDIVSDEGIVLFVGGYMVTTVDKGFVSGSIAVVKVYPKPRDVGVRGNEAEAADPTAGNEEMIGVISGVFVKRVLKRVGGAMLFNHSVVPLTTEK